MSATSSAPAKRVLLVIGGGISAYKVLEAIRRLRERGVLVRCILTRAGAEFVTPLTVGTLSAERVFSELFDLTDEHDVGHIKLARDCDLVVVAPATADFIAKMALGLANDLASTALLATDRPILIVPAMNPSMWAHPATQANVATLKARGVAVLGPAMGAMAERGESGLGRMVEPPEIVEAVMAQLAPEPGPLKGRHILVTSGPTREPIDPVRYIANHSSGKQGHAIAAAAAAAGARVTLVSGPVRLDDPDGVDVVHIETAREMLAACEAALPADAAVFAAAVADWRVARDAGQKIKKTGDGPPALALVENPDILATISRSISRPPLVIGFAAETEHVLDHAKAKLKRKGCDLIVANDVSPESGVMGGERNRVHLVSAAGVESWPDLSKDEVARRLVARIAAQLGEGA
ncbi:bifunctional phosphopantothenoylcysteine decarboxylase/phosphopantothenate--cysteine ligase CoaBC [Blastochloris tepida]|uniref:Coenzyme A biosynthesis bifunctional protein CoaBC n=1 Tax=Blastochloris tepida TaxID=2233851 RepID=A0A348G3V6_9HYPH|nr:bifunctional phosphopantothenoylcysteine decarboxylase/phosphopantothenate--cysteine ligase CoaBC [Blastochloris tepida]BBF94239.1 phosphopantothenate synthase [Blastochloris tepida]